MYGLYGFLTNLVMSGKLKFAPGKIDLMGERLALLSMNTIKQMTEDSLKRGKEGVLDLYFEGWVFGFEFTSKLVENLKLKQFEETYKVVMDMAALIGFGDFKTLEFRRGYAKFRVLQNPFAEVCAPSSVQVDHLLRGMNAGGGSVVHGEIINCVELECLAQGKETCLFVNGSDSVIASLDSALVSSQLDLDALRSKQQELIRKMGHDVAMYDEKKDYVAAYLRRLQPGQP